jgi:hypothetical protein
VTVEPCAGVAVTTSACAETDATTASEATMARSDAPISALPTRTVIARSLAALFVAVAR